MPGLVWLVSNALYFFDRVNYNYDWFMQQKRQCYIQCIDENGGIEYKDISFMRNSLIIFYALNNDPDYSWENVEYKFKKLGHQLRPGDKFETVYGDAEVVKYEDPIFGPKLAFKYTSIFVE